MSGTRSLSQIVEEHIASGNLELPVFDQTSARIRQMTDTGEYDVGAVERLVASDPALSGALLRHANSSFFGAIEKALTVRDAIVRLGIKQVSDLVLLAGQREQYRLQTPELRSVVDGLWRHAVGCAIGSQWLAKKLELGEIVSQAFLAGLLHDVGKLLLLRVLDDLLVSKTIRFETNSGLTAQVLDGLHAAEGYSLMSTWNVPELYGQIVRDHHKEELDEGDLLLALVRLVDGACNHLGIGIKGKVDINLPATNEAQILRVSEVVLAELEIKLEDALQLC